MRKDWYNATAIRINAAVIAEENGFVTLEWREIDLVIDEDGILYPVEIKMSGNPKASMASTNVVLDKIGDRKRGMGAIVCMVDKKTYLRENLVALPFEYV